MKKRSTKQNYSLPEMNGKNYSLEMGKFTPSKPIIGGRPQLSCLFEFYLLSLFSRHVQSSSSLQAPA